MANYRRSKTMGGTYFFTVVTYRRQKVLCNKMVRKALHDGIQTARTTQPFAIDAWVLLPDHLHCIWTLPTYDANFSGRWAQIKRYVSKICGPNLYCDEFMTPSKRRRHESTIWQRRFWEHQIRNEQDFEKHMNYIHYNPVKHNLVQRTKEWPYSTFHRCVRKGVYSENWGGGNIMDIEIGFGE